MFQERLRKLLEAEFKEVSEFKSCELNQFEVFFISSLVNIEGVNKLILTSILKGDKSEVRFPVIDSKKEYSISKAADMLLRGAVIVSNNKDSFFLSINLPAEIGRSVEPSEQETTLYTSLESFTEQIDQNLTLIRRFLPTSNLKSEMFTIGTLSKSRVALLFLKGSAKDNDVQLVKARIKMIDEKFIINSPFLGRLFSSSKSSFPQYQMTDKPDLISLALAQGKVIVLIDQNPFAIISPSSFFDFFLSAEDYIHNSWTAYLIRLVRLIGYLTSLLLVPLYVAITTHNYEAFPLELLFIVIESRSDVPFSPLWESILMLLTLEFLREASKRMPTKTGNTLGVVGGIIIGDAAVQAGIASNILIVMVGITAVSSFVVPNYIMATSLKIIRYLFLIVSYQFGLFGIAAAFCILIIHLNSIKSMNKPYLMPNL
ncbi:spore germination protein [Bacillus sp. MRMR6]|uniref:spore germination protein n=1 Tax=Bacillus sp. MRMR6 TaxID=1928617 RepID=UPI0009515DDF|nr:spore germination protein [Bacillus sp. MRMR6]OLS35274.1 hypothetical protein BTR25_20040 [Bacillus sp. MRMR6]